MTTAKIVMFLAVFPLVAVLASCSCGATRDGYSGSGGELDDADENGGAEVWSEGGGEEWRTDLAVDSLTDGQGYDMDGEEVPLREICGDGVDNDRDGEVDEGCGCEPGTSQECYGGPPEKAGIGACVMGRQWCEVAGGEFATWGDCTGWGAPSPEVCGDGVDNDCDASTDEGCICTLGESRSCYGGPVNTSGIGLCRDGVQQCIEEENGNLAWGPCEGQVIPTPDYCDDLDNDCDGSVDEGCECEPGETRSCYEGPAGTEGVGPCRSGSEICILSHDGMSSYWSGVCSDQVLPSPDLCDGTDNDCDGEADEGCLCVAGESRSCYTGPPGTSGVGICRPGLERCLSSPDGTATYWSGICEGEVLPQSETCGNRTDDDCDGLVDEGCCNAPWVTCPASPVTMRARETITLTATEGDLDGDIVTRRWAVDSSPVGALFTFGCDTCSSTSFRPDIAGVYLLSYTVTDACGLSARCTVEVRVTGLGLRIELVWSSTRADIDAHLLNGAATVWATAASDPNDCHWRNCIGGLAWPPAGAAGDARLDVDDVNGLGPENINVDQPNIGERYTVGIHCWNGHGDSSSDVTVRVYCGDISFLPVATYTRRLYCCGTASGAQTCNALWKVADVIFSSEDVCSSTPLDVVVPSGPGNQPR